MIHALSQCSSVRQGSLFIVRYLRHRKEPRLNLKLCTGVGWAPRIFSIAGDLLGNSIRYSDSGQVEIIRVRIQVPGEE